MSGVPQPYTRTEIALVTAALLIFALFSLAWISYPGFYEDETLFVNASFPNPSDPTFPATITIFHKPVPTMLMPYLGALKGLLWRLVFRVWPPSVYSVRVPAVFLAGLALLLFYSWARRFYARNIALAALALVAADPSYIYTARMDMTVVLQHLFCYAGLLFGAVWLEKSRDSGSPWRGMGWLAGCGFCFGLGLWDKALFIWFLTALFGTLLLLFRRDVWKRVTVLAVLVLVATLAAGAFPLIRYNVENLQKNRTATSGVVFLENSRADFIDKFRVLKFTLDGRGMYLMTGGHEVSFNARLSDLNGAAFFNKLAVLAPARGTLFPFALAGAAVVCFFAAGTRLPLLFPLLLTALMWVQMLAVKNAGAASHHYVLAYPLPQLAVAAAAAWVWSNHRKPWVRTLVVCVLVAVAITQLAWASKYLSFFRKTGGTGTSSRAIFDVAGYLEHSHTNQVVELDWGFDSPLQVLSQGKLNLNGWYTRFVWAASVNDARARLEGLLRQPGTLFLAHTEAFATFPAAKSFFDTVVQQAALHTTVVQRFAQGDGEIVAVLLRAEPGAEPAPGPPIELTLKPSEVHPGGDYIVKCHEFAGSEIDLQYTPRGKPAATASAFCKLDTAGQARIHLPNTFEPVVVDVTAVRKTGDTVWRPTKARITVR